MLVCNSWHYITCRQQSNSCGIVKVLFHMGEQSVELHSWGKGFSVAALRQLVQDVWQRPPRSAQSRKPTFSNTTSGPKINDSPEHGADPNSHLWEESDGIANRWHYWLSCMKEPCLRCIFYYLKCLLTTCFNCLCSTLNVQHLRFPCWSIMWIYHM